MPGRRGMEVKRESKQKLAWNKASDMRKPFVLLRCYLEQCESY